MEQYNEPGSIRTGDKREGRFLTVLIAGIALTLGAFPQSRIELLPATTFHDVSYVEVVNSTAARSAATAGLRDYLTGHKIQSGFLRFEAFEQAGRPGHILFVESWQVQNAFDQRSMEIQKKLVDSLQPIRISDIDRRDPLAFTAYLVLWNLAQTYNDKPRSTVLESRLVNCFKIGISFSIPTLSPLPGISPTGFSVSTRLLSYAALVSFPKAQAAAIIPSKLFPHENQVEP